MSNDCYNVLFLLNEVELVPDKAVSCRLPVISLFKNDFGAKGDIVNYRHWTFCQSISFVFPSEVNVRQIQESFSRAVTKLTVDTQRLNPVHPKYLLPINRSIIDTTLSMVPLQIFFITTSDSNFKINFPYQLLLPLYKHPMHQTPFRVSYEAQTTSDNLDNRSQFGEILTEMVFMCKFCEMLGESLMKTLQIEGYPFTDFSVKCSSAQSIKERGCRLKMQETYLNQTGDGKYLLYFIIPYFRFPINMTRFRKISDSKSAQEILSITSNLYEIELVILSETFLRHGGLDFHSKNFFFPWLALGDGNKYGHQNVAVDEVSYNFITCDPISSPINFYSYLKPFTVVVWCMIVISVLGTALVMLIMLQLLNYFAIRPNSELSFNSILLTITALLLGTEVYAGQMCRAKSLRGFLAVWIFSALILNTAYQGDNFANFIVPTSFNRNWKRLVEMGEFILCSPHGNKLPTADPFSNHFGFNFGKWIRARFDDATYSAFHKPGFQSANTYNYSLLENYDFQDQKDKIISKLFLNIRSILKYDHDDIVKLLSGCNNTAFVDNNQVISKTLGKIHRSSANYSHFYAGEETMFNNLKVWFFTKNSGSYIYKRCHYYVSSGIHLFWRDLLIGSHKKNANSEEPSSLSMNSNLVTIFYLLIGGCILSWI
ncbi:unnamed protein product [Orchesella dallaii]|uniref:Ionotropic glutamate receptor C-terminal domain-containing protein n=1 Tax=Orchesella dallaii TaxID=48710 RepID=A0ABP1Q713_9HEXA